MLKSIFSNIYYSNQFAVATKLATPNGLKRMMENCKLMINKEIPKLRELTEAINWCMNFIKSWSHVRIFFNCSFIKLFICIDIEGMKKCGIVWKGEEDVQVHEKPLAILLSCGDNLIKFFWKEDKENF